MLRRALAGPCFAVRGLELVGRRRGLGSRGLGGDLVAALVVRSHSPEGEAAVRSRSVVAGSRAGVEAVRIRRWVVAGMVVGTAVVAGIVGVRRRVRLVWLEG